MQPRSKPIPPFEPPYSDQRMLEYIQEMHAAGFGAIRISQGLGGVLHRSTVQYWLRMGRVPHQSPGDPPAPPSDPWAQWAYVRNCVPIYGLACVEQALGWSRPKIKKWLESPGPVKMGRPIGSKGKVRINRYTRKREDNDRRTDHRTAGSD